MDKPFKVIPNTPNVYKVEFHPHYSVTCSIGKTPFHGIMDIEIMPKNFLLEFESFEAWLFTLSSQSMTIEDLTRLVYDTLKSNLEPKRLRVTVHARTVVHGDATAIIE